MINAKVRWNISLTRHREKIQQITHTQIPKHFRNKTKSKQKF